MTEWTKEKVDVLKALWDKGLSCSQIAAEIPGFSRNAVIGKVHRMNLEKRGGTAMGVVPKKVRERQKAASRDQKMFTIVPRAKKEAIFSAETWTPRQDISDESIPSEQRRTLLQLEVGDCHFPVGDPRESSFFFCGAPAVVGYSYCHRHCSVAFEPPREKKRA